MKNEPRLQQYRIAFARIACSLSHIARIALDILFPPLCVHCSTYLQNSQSPLCASCLTSIATNTALQCPICNTRLADNKRTCNHGKQAIDRFPYLLGSASCYADPVIRSAIHACKYQGVHTITAIFSHLLESYVQQLAPQPHIFATIPTVVPIPLHMTKERERGFNQSALIARDFADRMGFPYEELLVKLEYTAPQAKTKTHQERFAHMRDVFAAPRPHAIANKNIILIDDVSTSGATLSEAARTLKTAGAKQILALVVAKA